MISKGTVGDTWSVAYWHIGVNTSTVDFPRKITLVLCFSRENPCKSPPATLGGSSPFRCVTTSLAAGGNHVPWSVLSSHSIHSDTEYNSNLIENFYWVLQGPDHSTSSRKTLVLWSLSPLQSAIFTGVDASFFSFLSFYFPGTC